LDWQRTYNDVKKIPIGKHKNLWSLATRNNQLTLGREVFDGEEADPWSDTAKREVDIVVGER